MWIAASYKTNRYQKWVEKGKRKLVDDDNSDDEGGGEGGSGNQGKGGKNKGKNFTSEWFQSSTEFLKGVEKGRRKLTKGWLGERQTRNRIHY